MEMMIVLLITAVIAAATAPMVTKKLSRNTGTGDSPWVFTGLENSIAFNTSGDDNSSVLIGASTLPDSLEGSTRLFIDSGGGADCSHIAFGNGNTEPLQLTADPNGRIGISNEEIPDNTIALGTGQNLYGANVTQKSIMIGCGINSGLATVETDVNAASPEIFDSNQGNIAIGHKANIARNERRAIAIGNHTSAGSNTVAIGHIAQGGLNADSANGVCIGSLASIKDHEAIAIGSQSNASEPASLAIGYSTVATAQQACAVGSINEFADSLDRVGSTTTASGITSTALGSGAQATNKRAVAIGVAIANGESSIAVGSNAKANGTNDIAIGIKSESGGSNNIVIGNYASTGYGVSEENIAIGHNATCITDKGIAIGESARAYGGGQDDIVLGNRSLTKFSNSVAIGNEVRTSAQNQIMLGNSNMTVYIPGNLVVGGQTVLGTRLSNSSNVLWLRASGHASWVKNDGSHGLNFGADQGHNLSSAYSTDGRDYTYSDKRLKNIGEKYTAGLNELKKLDFFHFTFKDDENKTPHVGVMAQDLQKVFPDAVTKDENGYLKIRWEDMFYAMINAVKELDNKFSEFSLCINNKISEQNKIIEKQQAEINELKETNKKLIKENEEIIKRLDKLEREINK